MSDGSEDGLITGRVMTAARTAVPGAAVTAHTVGLGREQLIAQGTTDARGVYTVTYPPDAIAGGGRPDLRLRATRAGVDLGASKVLYNAPPAATIDLVVETAKVVRGPEHGRLVADLDPHVAAAPDRDRLGDLVETPQRRDITYLANKTGWDARAVAMAAAADQMSDGTALPANAFYALFRAGLPAHRQTLARTRPEQAQAIWQRASADGVLPPLSTAVLAQYAENFAEFAAGALLAEPPPTGLSPLGEMLGAAGIPTKDRETVAATYAAAPDGAAFWEAVESKLGKDATVLVRTAARLGYFTVNNAPLMQSLIEIYDEGDPVQMVRSGLYTPQNWSSLLKTGAVPPGIPGATDGQRRSNYAELLASQLQIGFPTAVVATMVRNKEIPVATGQDPAVANFLDAHLGDFELGQQPVQAYLRDTGLTLSPAVTGAVETLQRQYQLTPSNRAMRALAVNRIDSALTAVKYREAEFVDQFAGAIGSEDEARLIHAKAQQIHLATLGVATGYLLARTSPAVHAVPAALATTGTSNSSNGSDSADSADGTGGSAVAALAAPPATAAAGNGVLAYPTLEQMFGELDFCSCEHCRSVLSPAAYLVDLLMFCDKRRFNAAGEQLPADFEGDNPLDELLARRPDIAHLELTCANTNVALPYVDLVNEVLEHFVVSAQGSLADFRGFNVDTDDTSEDLLASPRHVDPDAYLPLATQRFPLALPFDRALAGMRAYLDRATGAAAGPGRSGRSPLADLMEALRRTEALLPGTGVPYGWRDILIERLGIGRAEHTLLTTRTGVPLADLYGTGTGTGNNTSDAVTLSVIGSAKALARRLELSYEELAELTRTRFVNPQSWLLGRLDRLGLSFATIEVVGGMTDAQLDALLPSNLDRAPYGGNPRQWLVTHTPAIGTLLVLSSPPDADPCSFDQVRLQHALDDTPLTAVEARRIVRFVRLWRRLGWSIDATDRAVNALWPAAQRPLPGDSTATAEAKLDAGFTEVLLRLGHLVDVMDRLDLDVERDLPAALALWAPIDTVGPTSLYHRMFLAPSIVQLDTAFAESPAGVVLDGSTGLVAHRGALEAAFALDAGDLDVLLTVVGFDAQTPLTVANVSVLFRWAFLARRMELSVRELVALRDMTGIDPFGEPASPRPPLVRFLDVVERLRAADMDVAPLLYLLRHELQQGTPTLAELLEQARTLHDDLGRIERENALVADPDETYVRDRVAAVHGPAAADTFMGLVTGSVGFDVAYTQAGPHLPAAVVAATPGLRYDHLAERLHHAGLLSADQHQAVLGAAGVTAALSQAVGQLRTEGLAATQQFFAAHQELADIYDTVMEEPEAAERMTGILLNVLPDLQRRLQELRLVQALASDTDLPPADVSRLVRDPAVLHRIATGSGDAPLAAGDPSIDDLRGVGRSGASMTTYNGSSATGTPTTAGVVVEHLDFSRPGHPLPPNTQNANGVISGVWRWYLDPPASGPYALSIETDITATVTVAVDGLTVAGGRTSPAVWDTTSAIELTAGRLAQVTVTVTGVRDRLAIRWTGPGLPREVVPPARMLPAPHVDRFVAAYGRVLKLLALAARLGLDGEEVAWFAPRFSHRIAGESWPNALPVTTSVPTSVPTATVQGLFSAVLELADYVALRGDLRVRDHRLLDVLRDPERPGRDPSLTARAEATGWPDAAVAAVLPHVGLDASDLDNMSNLRRVAAVMDAADRVGVPAQTLVTIVTNAPTDAQVGQLQAALRARHDDATWNGIVGPVNDRLRDQRRDALVAHVLQRLRSAEPTAHIDTAEKLFEWFLLDVEMEPCMQTSRLRQALSSVQLFVQRCLLGLEPQVAPPSIDRQRWSWMQRYRVWEANRKVFLQPENWLEPELRDDKSPLYRQLEGELLATDVTDEAAARSLGRYLEGLTEVATLEVEGMCVEEGALGAADDVVHVVARTSGARRKHFYRRRSPAGWTAWEPMPLDIEDGPVVPAVWRDRLFVFWLRVLDGTPEPAGAAGVDGNTSLVDLELSQVVSTARRRMVAMLQWSELLDGAWAPPSTSDPARPSLFAEVDATAFDRSKLHLATRPGAEGTLVVELRYPNAGATHFRLYTPHSLPVRKEDDPITDSPPGTGRKRSFQVDPGLSVSYEVPDADEGAMGQFTHDVLTRGHLGHVVEPRHPLAEALDAPFFYRDRRHVLYVNPVTSLVRVPEYEDLVVQTERPIVRVDDFPLMEFIPEVDLSLPKGGPRVPEGIYEGGFGRNPVGTYTTNPNVRSEITTVGSFDHRGERIASGGALDADGKEIDF